MDKAAMEKDLMDRENAAWKLIKDKKIDEFGKMMSENYHGVYDEGIVDKMQELANLKNITLESVALSDMKVAFPSKDTAVVTYKAEVKGSYQNKPFAAVWNTSSVWAMCCGDWKVILHTEVVPK